MRLNGFVVIVVEDRILAECQKPWAHPMTGDMSAKSLYCLYVSGKLFKKAISVRFESPFVIGLPYSTVI